MIQFKYWLHIDIYVQPIFKLEHTEISIANCSCGSMIFEIVC